MASNKIHSREIIPISQWRSASGKTYEEAMAEAREKTPKSMRNKKYINRSNKRTIKK